MRLVRWQGLRVVCELPVNADGAISADGQVIAGFHVGGGQEHGCAGNGDVWLRVLDGEGQLLVEQARPRSPIALADDGSWLVVVDGATLRKLDTRTGASLAEGPAVPLRSLAIVDGMIYGREQDTSAEHAWRAGDLSTAALAPVDGPTPGRGGVVACGPRFAVGAPRGRFALWDRKRDRSLLWLTGPWIDHFAVVDGRFALGTFRRDAMCHLAIVDLTDGSLHAERELPLDARHRVAIAATAAGDRAVVTACKGGSGRAVWAGLLALDWLRAADDAGEPLAEAWDAADDPPICKTLAEHLASKPSDPPGYVHLVHGHPAFEVQLAEWLAADSARRLLRRAVRDSAIAARPEVWRRLARAALERGDVEHARDAAAEGLARASEDPALLAVLRRAEELRALPDARPVRSWQAHGGSVRGLTIVGERVISVGADSRVRVWKLATGERLFSRATGTPATCVATDGWRFAVGTDAGKITVFDATTYARIAGAVAPPSTAWFRGSLGRFDQPPEARPLAITGLAWSGAELVSAGDDHVIRWWTIRPDSLEVVVHTSYDQGLGVHDSPLLACVAGEAIVQHGDGLECFPRETYGGHRHGEPFGAGDTRDVTALAVVGEGLAYGNARGEIHVDGRVLELLDGAVRSLAVASTLVVAAGESGAVHLWRNGETVARGAHPGATALASDGEHVVSGSADGTIRVW